MKDGLDLSANPPLDTTDTSDARTHHSDGDGDDSAGGAPEEVMAQQVSVSAAQRLWRLAYWHGPESCGIRSVSAKVRYGYLVADFSCRSLRSPLLPPPPFPHLVSSSASVH